MLRTDFFGAIERIELSIASSGLDRMLARLIKSNGHGDTTADVLQVFQSLTLARAGFGSAETQVLSAFELSDLYDTSLWQTLTSGSSEQQVAVANDLLRAWSRLLDVKPRLAQLLDVDEGLIAGRAKGDPSLQRSVIELIVVETPQSPVTPLRLSAMFKSLHDLASAAATLYEVDADLQIVFIDSGSDVHAFVKGGAEVIRFFKDTFATVWGRLALTREIQAEKRIEMVAKSVPVILEIRAKAGKLGQENATLLEGVVVDAIGKFVESGSTLAGLENTGSPDDRKLITSPTKLLTHVPPVDQLVPPSG